MVWSDGFKLFLPRPLGSFLCPISFPNEVMPINFTASVDVFCQVRGPIMIGENNQMLTNMETMPFTWLTQQALFLNGTFMLESSNALSFKPKKDIFNQISKDFYKVKVPGTLSFRTKFGLLFTDL